jgi:RNA polymerase sigma-70 factor, ECF subfamily
MAGRELDRTRLGDHIDRLYRAAWGLCGSRHEAEDLVQETFVRVLSRPRILRNDDDLGYLLRALQNTFLSARRTAARRPAGTSFDELPEPLRDTGRPGPEDAAEAQEVYAAIAALPERCRLALVAVDIAGLSYREAARMLRVREGAVTSRLYRARKMVAERLAVSDGQAEERAVADAVAGQHARVPAALPRDHRPPARREQPAHPALHAQRS